MTTGRAAELLAASVAIAAIVVVLADMTFILKHHVSYPFGDQWIWLSRLYEFGFLRNLYGQYNEHRLVIPGLFFFLDYHYFGGSNGFLSICELALQTGCAALLAFPVWREQRVGRPVKLVFSGFVLVLMFWFLQAENLFLPYQIQIVCSNFGLLAIAILLPKLAARQHAGLETNRLLIAILGLALWSMFSFAHGMLIWPAVLVFAAVSRLPKRIILPMAVTFAAAMAVYFYHYQPSAGTGSPLESLTKPMQLLQYSLLLLGSPFFGQPSGIVNWLAHPVTYLISAAGVAAAIYVLARIVFVIRSSATQAETSYGVTLLVTLSTAAFIAVGRSGISIEQALSGRYTTMALIFWISLAGLVTTYLSRLQSHAGAIRAAWCVVLVLSAVATRRSHQATGSNFASLERDQAAATVSFSVGVPDTPRIERTMSSVTLVAAVEQATQRTLGRSMFPHREASLIGSPLLSHFRLAPSSTCQGRVESARMVADGRGVLLTGWAWNQVKGALTPGVWVADQSGTIRGFGVTGKFRPAVAAAQTNETLSAAGWDAYAASGDQPGPYAVYADAGDGKSVCRIGSSPPPQP
ncbi:hypothetical protein [uncultured Paludibaculum sp.]|uniref:hypothetical protein n=1 Tax=uncultured Paludibaculum sp. TaxID=1765020 RepID=UPI002AAB1F51|nr:hypothetical protein [uncultured Paludibaculum sp.]